ncbi:CarboxypepD_reg-like domain-containing protein [Aquimarina amphilecti]|uniref:CarboxypepD_reg-like domain-containing protein n=1 Tax=Aquimarina amphilecti TaxID=1038014 RepID=A0A1H7WDH7_AQUAM|nr:carboxypeptidase-like regulatory domain-containing protein [Aquimarina amphilecti]SEM19058.1 CarboxypepD_reg-like domain-containing protein [Aquimarina amphilecti]
MKPQNLTQLIYLLLFLLPVLASSQAKKKKQETYTIEATVLDKNSKNPLPFTNVLIEGTSIGTITNEEGKFELTISKKYESFKVVFSFVGYENSSLSVKKLKDTSKKVYLKPISTSLDEIVVTAKNKYKELIDQAISLISKNYSQKSIQLEAYYRELTKIDDSYTKFSDAASIIQYSAYDSNFDYLLSNTNYIQFNRLEYNINQVPYPEPKEFVADTRDQAKIIALRKSNNLQDYRILEQSKKLKSIDTLNLKWLENNEIGGGPLRLTGADKIKRREDFFDPKINSKYLFTLYGKSIYNNKPVFIISFKPKDSNNIETRYKGEITLDKESKAIIAYQYQLTKKAKKALNQRFATQLKTPETIEKKTKKAFITRITSLKNYKIYVTFSNYKDKWYLKRIKAINSYENTGDLFENYKITTESELIVGAVDTGRTSPLAGQEVFKNNFSNALFNYPLSYDSEFWNNYNSLIATGVIGKALEDLEVKGSLESQFKNKN